MNVRKSRTAISTSYSQIICYIVALKVFNTFINTFNTTINKSFENMCMT